MKRLALASLVNRALTKEDIVVCGLGATEAAFKEARPVCPTYFASDPMGIWPSLALGLALARPRQRVTLLAGDGDLLMNLQVLATIAGAPAKNFRIVVFHNGAYSSTGGQRLAAADRLSFAAIARGAGFEWALEAASENEAAAALAGVDGTCRAGAARRSAGRRALPADAARTALSGRGAHAVHAGYRCGRYGACDRKPFVK